MLIQIPATVCLRRSGSKLTGVAALENIRKSDQKLATISGSIPILSKSFCKRALSAHAAFA